VSTRTDQWDQLPELMTVKETAAALRVSTNWVYEDARSGCLKPAATRLGRSIRIRKDALRRLLEGGDA